MEQNRQPIAGMENAGAAGGSNLQPLGTDSVQNDGAQLPGEKKTGAKKRESGEGDQSKSTQFRRSQAVGEFLCECKGFAASAISAIVRLSYCSEIAISQLEAIDAYCVDLFLDDKCSAKVIDEASVQGHRCMRAAKLWKTAQLYVNRDAMADTCMALMALATDFNKVRASKQRLENVRRNAAKSDG